MDANKILQASNFFLRMVKRASVRGNMAKRIMFSLLSHLVPEGEQSRVYYTRGAIDIKALRQLIPGAKELIEYGIMACLEEITWHTDSQVVEKMKNIAAVGEDRYTLKSLILFFSRNDWSADFFGGENWKKIAKTLLDIKIHLDNALEARKTNDLDREVDELMNMSSYLNVLDGLAHNTGSIMEKIVSIEKNKSNYDDEKYKKELESVERLMDVKELKDPDDVIQEIIPTLDTETDAPLTMKDWVGAARRKYKNYSGSHEERENILKKIRLKKQLIQILNDRDLPKIIAKLDQWKNLPDNKLVQKLSENKVLFFDIRAIIRFILKFIDTHKHILGKSNYTIEEKSLQYLMSSKLEHEPLYKVRNAFWDVYELLLFIQKIPEEIANF